jgi:putative nucleotidyltransferase with HDIG domain
MNRNQAWELLNEYTKKDGLLKHALAVEAVMRAYGEKFGEDADAWGIVGLLHDFDYERYPSLDDHPQKGVEILRAKGLPLEWTMAIAGHGRHTGVRRESLMAKTLFAVDELTGFIVAVALVRPSRKIADVAVKSVKKKMKDRAFAANVSREDIVAGAKELGVDLEEHIGFVIGSMQGIADELGL